MFRRVWRVKHESLEIFLDKTNLPGLIITTEVFKVVVAIYIEIHH